MSKVKNLVKLYNNFCDFMDKPSCDLSPKDRSKQMLLMYVILSTFLVVSYTTFLMLFY